MSDALLAEKGDWDSLIESEKKQQAKSENNDGKRKLEFMSFPNPGQYTVRLVGDHVSFLKHFSPINATTHEDWKGEDPAWKAGFYPRRRYAIHIIDRADGKLKILEKGPGIFKKFSNYKAVKGINPAGKDGPNFIISVKIPKDSNGQFVKRQTEYEVMPDEKAPLTEEEVAMIKEQGFYDLSKIYSTTPLDKIQEMWDAVPDNQKIPPKKEDENSSDSNEKPSKPVSKPAPKEKMPDAPADSGQDIFEDEKASASSSGEEPLF